MESNEIIVADPVPQTPNTELQINWEQLCEGLDKIDQEILPLMAFGVPYTQIADFLGLEKSAVTKRLSRHPRLAIAVAHARKMIKLELHRIWLNQKAVKAWANVDYFLSLDPFAVDEKTGKPIYSSEFARQILSEKAKMTRFVLEQLGLRVQKVEVEHSAPRPLFLGNDSAAAMVIEAIRRVENKDVEEITALPTTEYRVIDDTEIEESEEEESSDTPWDSHKPGASSYPL